MIRVGVGPIAAGSERQALRDRARDVLAGVLGDAVSLEASPTYVELGKTLGAVDVVWLPPALCVRALDQGMTLLLASVRDAGTQYHGALFVPSASVRYRPEDLEGLRVAWVDPDSCGGYLFPRAALVERELDPNALFKEEKMLGSHRAVVRAVEAGEADCGATYLNSMLDGSTQAGWTREGKSAMRAVLVSRPIPADALCAAPSLPSDRREKIGAALADLHTKPEGAAILKELFQVTRLEPSSPLRYDVVRSALETNVK
jgi:phosphonate transport system substrate-binding protein